MTKGRFVPAFLSIDCLLACFAEAERAIFSLILFVLAKEKPPQLPAAVSHEEAPGGAGRRLLVGSLLGGDLDDLDRLCGGDRLFGRNITGADRDVQRDIVDSAL